MKTVKQLANELNVSKATIHRTLHKLNQNRIIETIQDGNKILIDDSIEKAIILEINAKLNQRETIQNDSETFANDSKTNHCNDSETIFCNDDSELQREYIELLKAQIDDLRADKHYLQERLTAAEQERAALTAERDKLTAERQALLAEMLELRQPKVIEVMEPEPTTKAAAAPAPAPASERKTHQHKQQPERRGTLQKLLRRFTGRK